MHLRTVDSVEESLFQHGFPVVIRNAISYHSQLVHAFFHSLHCDFCHKGSAPTPRLPAKCVNIVGTEWWHPVSISHSCWGSRQLWWVYCLPFVNTTMRHYQVFGPVTTVFWSSCRLDSLSILACMSYVHNCYSCFTRCRPGKLYPVNNKVYPIIPSFYPVIVPGKRVWFCRLIPGLKLCDTVLLGHPSPPKSRSNWAADSLDDNGRQWNITSVGRWRG